MMFNRIFIAHILLVLLVLFCGRASPAITFLSTPQDVDVLHGEVAIFNCSGEGHDLWWSYDGQELTSELKMAKNITIVTKNTTSANGTMILSSMLETVADEDNDIVISCTILTLQPYCKGFRSAALTFRRVSHVRNLTLTNTAVMWMSPAQKPDIADLMYNISIIEIKSESNKYCSVFITGETQFMLLGMLKSCIKYSISVNAFYDQHYYDETYVSKTTTLLQHSTGGMFYCN